MILQANIIFHVSEAVDIPNTNASNGSTATGFKRKLPFSSSPSSANEMDDSPQPLLSGSGLSLISMYDSETDDSQSSFSAVKTQSKYTYSFSSFNVQLWQCVSTDNFLAFLR